MPPLRRGSRSRRRGARAGPATAARRAPGPGPRRGSRALAAPCETTMIRRATPRHPRVEGDPGDVRLDMRRRRHGQRRCLVVERLGAREDRQDMAVRTDAEEHEIEGRPAALDGRALRPEASPRIAGRPSRPEALGDRLPGRNRMDVLGRDRRPGRPTTGDIRAGAAGAGLAAERADLEQVGHRDLGVRQRMVRRDEPLVAPPQLDELPWHAIAKGRRRRGCDRSRPASSRRSSPSGRARGR